MMRTSVLGALLAVGALVPVVSHAVENAAPQDPQQLSSVDDYRVVDIGPNEYLILPAKGTEAPDGKPRLCIGGATGLDEISSRSPDARHLIGHFESLCPFGYCADRWVTTPEDGSAISWYGPYATKWGAGTHYASFYLDTDNTKGSTVIGELDITFNSQRVLVFKVQRNHFRSPFFPARFVLAFEDPCYRAVEARVITNGQAWMGIRSVSIGGYY